MKCTINLRDLLKQQIGTTPTIPANIDIGEVFEFIGTEEEHHLDIDDQLEDRQAFAIRETAEDLLKISHNSSFHWRRLTPDKILCLALRLSGNKPPVCPHRGCATDTCRLTSLPKHGTILGETTFPAHLMTELRIRKLDDWVTTWLKAQAKFHGHSLERELRELLTETVRSRKQQITDELLHNLETLEQKHGLFPDGTEGIRHEREKRG